MNTPRPLDPYAREILRSFRVGFIAGLALGGLFVGTAIGTIALIVGQVTP